jgi:hypothetical protein
MSNLQESPGFIRGEGVKVCPTPEKVIYRSKFAALVARDEIERDNGIDLGLKSYPCCGHWHLGHRHKNTLNRWNQNQSSRRNAARRRR